MAKEKVVYSLTRNQDKAKNKTQIQLTIKTMISPQGKISQLPWGTGILKGSKIKTCYIIIIQSCHLMSVCARECLCISLNSQSFVLTDYY